MTRRRSTPPEFRPLKPLEAERPAGPTIPHEAPERAPNPAHLEYLRTANRERTKRLAIYTAGGGLALGGVALAGVTLGGASRAVLGGVADGVRDIATTPAKAVKDSINDLFGPGGKNPDGSPKSGAFSPGLILAGLALVAFVVARSK